MSEFEFVFSFFGLLLGFTLVEVLSGLVRAVKARRKVRLGWLTPLLGIFVLLQITSFWIAAWNVRELIPATDVALLLGLAFTGTYYFAASLVFPEQSVEWEDLDQWYFQNKRTTLTLVLLADAVQSAFEHWLRREVYDTASFVAVAMTGLLVLAAIMTKRKRSNLILLSALAAMAFLASINGEKVRNPVKAPESSAS